MGGDEVGAELCSDGVPGERYREVGLPHARRAEEERITRVVGKAQGLQLPGLSLVDAGLDAEVEVAEGLHVGEVGQAHPCAQVASAARLRLAVQESGKEIGGGRLLLGGARSRWASRTAPISGQAQSGEGGVEVCDHGNAPPPPSA